MKGGYAVNGQLRLKGRNRFAKGFRLIVVVVVVVSTLYAALLYANLLRNQRQTEEEVFTTAYKNAASLISFVDHEGFRKRIFDEEPAIEKLDYFTEASNSQIHGQQIISPYDSFIGPLNPFIPGTPMHDFVDQVRLFTQVSFDIEMLLFHTPANDYFIGAENGGRSSIIALGESAAANALHITEAEVEQLLSGNDLVIAASDRDSGRCDQVIFSIDIGHDVTMFLRTNMNVLHATLMKANYGRQFSPVAVALLAHDKGIYWLGKSDGFVTRESFLNLGQTDWAAAPRRFSAQSGEDNLVVLNYELSQSGYCFRHVVAMEKNEYEKMNRDGKMLMIGLTLLWIFACGTIGIILYHEWYAPVSRMLAQMKAGQGEEDGLQPEPDEYAVISNEIERMRQDLDHHQAALARHREALRRVVLSRLLQSPGSVLTAQAAAQHNLTGLLRRYALTAFFPSGMAESDALEGVAAALEAQLGALLHAGEEAILLPQTGQVILLIASGDRKEADLMPLLMRCLPALHEAYHGEVRFYCGGFGGDPSLHSAYTRALMDPALMYPQEMEELHPATNAMRSRMRLSCTMNLLSHLDAHDYEKAKQSLAKTLDTIFAEAIPLPLRFTLLSGLSGDLYCRIMEANKGAKEILDSMPMQYPNGEISTREEFLSRWTALFDSLCTAAEQAKGRSVLFEQLMSYIDEHYQDSDLSLTKLADLFDVGTATISREFKKNSESTFLEIMHKRRIAAAKTLIRTTDISLKEIASQVGYDNALTMTRAFKKYEGATPGAFRES